MNMKLLNVVGVGVAFMLVFTAFQTGSTIQLVMINSITNETKSSPDPYTGNSNTSLAIIYAVFALFNWFTPPIISVIGPRLSMFVAALTYILFIANFLYPMTWGLYFCSALIGIGAAVIWTAQGTYLTLNSDKETISRNSGIFWALMQCSLLFGNLFFFLELSDVKVISSSQRELIYGVLTVVGLVGCVVFALLRPSPPAEGEVKEQTKPNLKHEFSKAFKLLESPLMLFLCITFFYTGLELSFFSGIYSSAIGQTNLIAETPKRYIGLSGLIIGVGEITGGVLFGILGDKTKKIGRDSIVLLGGIVQLLAFGSIMLNLPAKSVFDSTDQPAMIASNLVLALVGSFMLGFGDSCFNTQIYSIIGSMFSEDSAPAFAIFKFVQSLATAIAFFYAPVVNLYGQLGILIGFGVLGTISFFVVESKARKLENTKS